MIILLIKKSKKTGEKMMELSREIWVNILFNKIYRANKKKMLNDSVNVLAADTKEARRHIERERERRNKGKK